MSYESAFDAAIVALRHRDRTTMQLDRHLAERGFAESDRCNALAALTRTGVVDDARYGGQRARALGERGAGDAFIRHDLHLAGLGTEDVELALSVLDPEHERAERVVERRGASPKTARYLAGKGFAEDVVRAAVARGTAETLG